MSTASRVVPGISLTSIRSSPTSRLRSEDFPTFGRPTIAILIAPASSSTGATVGASSSFDAISSIGLTEHIGVKNYPSYFSWIRDHLKPHGRLLNHCITRNDNKQKASAGAFIDRYVFPDGELIGSGTIVSAVEDCGLEVQHHENIRVHYAKTLAAWCQNLAHNWDACVAETNEGTAKVWGLYMAGSRLAFERNEIQLHHVLATKTDRDGESGYPLRHTF